MPAKIDPALPPHNALLLDPQSQVLRSGAGAKTLLAANAEVLRVQQGRLVAPRQRFMPGQTLALARPGRLPLSLLSQTLTDAQGCTIAFLVTLVDPEANRLDRQMLQDLFDLTRTEARIAAALADGRGTDQIAGELGVQINTVHAHIKKLLAKTTTRRQPELVSMLWRSVSTTTAPPPRAPLNGHPPWLAGEPLLTSTAPASSGNDAVHLAGQTEAC